MDKYEKANLANWNARVYVHTASRFYNVKAFKRGKTSLHALELKELGPVKGKTLLHLQCHFGMDTLSWARLGATVTGADFSDKAISCARELAEETGIEASFVLSSIYNLPKVLSGEFDIVFASYGTLCWISDLKRWMKTASHFLKPGGTLYIADYHPFANIFDESGEKPEISYFHAKAIKWPPGCTYTDGPRKTMPATYEWLHSVGDIFSAVRSCGLRLEYFHEFPYCPYARFKKMKKRKDGFYEQPGNKTGIPLLFSLKATKTA